MAFLEATQEVLDARNKWRYRGANRPDFATPTPAGCESVWDFPRPPAIEAVAETVSVRFGDKVIAHTASALRVCETAGAPTYYIPIQDTDLGYLTAQAGRSLCEWKGLATSHTVCGLPSAAWHYAYLFEEFAALWEHYAFYATVLDCRIGNERVLPQPGGYYGGWVTKSLTGPIKGEPNSESWW